MHLTGEPSVLPQANRCPRRCPRCTLAASRSSKPSHPGQRQTETQQEHFKTHKQWRNKTLTNWNRKLKNCCRCRVTAKTIAAGANTCCTFKRQSHVVSYLAHDASCWQVQENWKEWKQNIVNLPAGVRRSWADLWLWSKRSRSRTAHHSSPDAAAGWTGPDLAAWWTLQLDRGQTFASLAHPKELFRCLILKDNDKLEKWNWHWMMLKFCVKFSSSSFFFYPITDHNL